MLSDALRTLLQSEPFLPFTIVMMGGSEHHIQRPESVTVDASGRIAHVTRPDRSYSILDLWLATELRIDEELLVPIVVSARPVQNN